MLGLGAALLSRAVHAATEPDGDTGKDAAKSAPDPVVFTTQQDRQNMLDQLGIAKLRPGRSSSASSPGAAKYDEAKANPNSYPELPEMLKAASGQTVDTPEAWWKRRRPEIVEHFIRWAEATEEPESARAGDDRRSLQEAVGKRFKLGVGVSHRVLQNPEDVALIRQHFSILTPENCMKPRSIHPAEGRWNFAATDRFVDFARKNELGVVGHCLVWAKDDRTSRWMMRDDGEPVSRTTLLRRIEAHIRTVVERYADAVTMWDVVNEAIGDGDDGLLRDSVYSRTSGIDFIVTAFKAARAADPDALLIYNDYNGHKPAKRQKLIELLKRLEEKGAGVDAYGMQGHFELGDESIPQLRETFDELRKLGVKVVVSELDIDVVTRDRWWADGGKYREELTSYDPYRDGMPEEIRKQQADQYVALFKLFDEYSDLIERVSFWNLHDGQSWLNYFPWRRVNHPLLFDRDRQPKPAFDAVHAYLSASSGDSSSSSASTGEDA